jgi:hypothetical protein
VEQPKNAGVQKLPFILGLGEKREDLVFKEAWDNRKFLPDKRLDELALEVNIDKGTWRRYQLAKDAFRKWSNLRDNPNPFVIVRAKSLPMDYVWRGYEAVTVVVSMMIANIVYGGVHLLAWDGPLPSRTQLFLWRISAITISAPGVVVVVLGVSIGVLIVSIVIGLLVYEVLNGVLGCIAFVLVLPLFIVALALFITYACIGAIVWLCKSIFKRLFGAARDSRVEDDAPGGGDAGDTVGTKVKDNTKKGDNENDDKTKGCENTAKSNNIGDNQSSGSNRNNKDIMGSENAGDTSNTEHNEDSDNNENTRDSENTRNIDNTGDRNNGDNENIGDDENTKDSSTRDSKNNSDNEGIADNERIVDNEGIANNESTADNADNENIEDNKTGNAQATAKTQPARTPDATIHGIRNLFKREAHSNHDLEAGWLMPQKWQERLWEKLAEVIQRLFWWIVCAVGILYLLSRAYIIVECFLGLPYAPDPVFIMPNWSRYLPHIG